MQYTLKSFKELTNIELYNILQLRQEIFIIEQNCIYPDIDNKDENAQHLLVFDANKLIGCLRILDRGVTYDEISIGRVVVAKNRRREGIAHKMVQKALDLIKNELKENYIRISAQAYTIPFYEGLGFEVVSEPYIEDQIFHVEMLCDLGD